MGGNTAANLLEQDVDVLGDDVSDEAVVAERDQHGRVGPGRDATEVGVVGERLGDGRRPVGARKS
jgi:hypothetical protein